MWFLFHAKSKTRVVAGGESFVQKCPSCKERSRFVEIEVEDNVGVFFIDVIGNTERAFRCGGCGEMFANRAETPAPAPARAPAPRKSLDELLAEDRLRKAAQRQIAQERSDRIEDELADLKRRAGR